jgi:choline dehydrogenase-like flavoprotein
MDSLGMPRVQLDWRLTSLAEQSLARTQELVVADLNSIGIQCAQVGPGGMRANQTVDHPRWVWHHMGTTRMSARPQDGVVDADCRVHGMSNLFIAGSSVFPTCSTDMPTLTLIALAHRLADHLKSQLNLPLSDGWDLPPTFSTDDRRTTPSRAVLTASLQRSGSVARRVHADPEI